MSGAGDANGDGLKDIVIGAPESDAGAGARLGSAFVVFGSSSLPSAVDLAALGSRGIRINGVAPNALTGFSVAGVGDMNGDGVADVAVGAPYRTGDGQKGSAYVVYGSSTPSSLNLASLTSGGFRVDGAASNDLAGYSVAGAGDVNGDGRPDLAMGAPHAADAGASDTGAAYVVFGRQGGPSSGVLDLANLGSSGIRAFGGASGDQSGYTVAGAGDVNGDGRADLLVGAPRRRLGAAADVGPST